MAKVLVVDAGLPGAMVGRSLMGGTLEVELLDAPARLLERAEEAICDLLVLCGMTAEEQAELVTGLHAHRRWRLVPVLYVSDPAAPGLAIPGTFRPEIDGLARGSCGSEEVERKIAAMAREGVGGTEPVIAGPFELDPVRMLLRVPGGEIELTGREVEIVAMLLGHANRTVTAAEIIERGWGGDADARSLQILRRHISNIRRKLQKTAAGRAVRTVRGTGYRFEVRAS